MHSKYYNSEIPLNSIPTFRKSISLTSTLDEYKVSKSRLVLTFRESDSKDIKISRLESRHLLGENGQRELQ